MQCLAGRDGMQHGAVRISTQIDCFTRIARQAAVNHLQEWHRFVQHIVAAEITGYVRYKIRIGQRKGIGTLQHQRVFLCQHCKHGFRSLLGLPGIRPVLAVAAVAGIGKRQRRQALHILLIQGSHCLGRVGFQQCRMQ